MSENPPIAQSVRSPSSAESLENEIAERVRTHGGFRQLLESAPDAFIIADHHGQIVLANKEAERIFGYSRAELLGLPIETLIPQRFHAMHIEHRDGYAASPRTRPMGSGLELYGLRKDGSEFPVEISLSPLETKEGLLVSAAIRDVTERKQAQERLRRYAEQLQQSNIDLQQFASVASHDLQEPLRTIATFCDMLHRSYQGRFDAQADQWLAFVMDGARRMQALVQDLLAYSRLESRAQPWQTVHCGEVFKKATANLQSLIEETGATLTCGELPDVQGDPAQLVQLFQNLLSNSIKFRGSQPPRIHASAVPSDDMFEFSFSDNGLGIDPKHHERIFELFKRLHPADRYPGTGLGLAICRKVVIRHGGRIWVESEPGRGSTFHFTIPLHGVSES
jgi:PAS domain S-box-containing protein